MAKASIEDRPQSDFEDFSILAFFNTALWEKKQKA